MSVAFRRESDEEHQEPRFERPIPPGANLVTERGRTLIEERIAALEATVGTAAGEQAEGIRRDLRYWHTRRTTAVETAPPTDGSVGFGSTIEVMLGGRRRRLAIVGDDEADPRADLIAFSAPLARALIGAEAGDVLPFNGRDGAIEVIAVV